jgi:hypothetical protein
MDVLVKTGGRSSSHYEAIIQNVSNIIDAKNKLARMKGYESYGDMVASFQRKGNNPPYTFTKIRD